ncbi:MAG: family 20 glycosylhydrolase [Bacteroides sp.]|uniref:family 20 glycosylhydrolase n=1 Tax=Bacteroides sp. TaxID=29523 RepID=UPI002FC5B9A5
MKKLNLAMKKCMLFIAIVLVVCEVSGKSDNRKYKTEQGKWRHEKTLVIPAVQEATYGDSYLVLNPELRIFSSKKLKTELHVLSDYLINELGKKVIISKHPSEADIVLSCDHYKKESENYGLVINEKGIHLNASSSAGIYYGIQTLRQLIHGRDTIPQIVINDAPTYPIRSLMLDEARHFKGKKVVKQLLENMARLKMNTFHWHLTDDQGWRIEIKKYPKLTEIGGVRDSTEISHFHSNVFDGKSHGGFYTQADIREIVAYAQQRHIQIIPEIEIPGHASAAIAAYPWLGTQVEPIRVPCNFGVHYNVYNVADPKVFEFFNDVIDEIIDLFPGKIIHIGGDEVRYDYWKASADIEQMMKEKSIKSFPELQVWTTNRMAQLLKRKGRRMMGWNEITGDQINDYQRETVSRPDFQLEKESIVQFWKGDKELMKKIASEGYDIINSANDYTYMDYSYASIPLQKAYGFNPIPAGFPQEYHKQVKGISCQVWGEFMPTVEKMNQMVYPRIAAYAEVGWTRPENKNWETFKQALCEIQKEWHKAGILYYEDAENLNPEWEQAINDFKAARLARPSTNQYNWQEMERAMFIQLDPATIQRGEYDNGTTPMKDICFPLLDVYQWTKAAKSWGAKEIIFMLAHSGGFCMWPSKTTDYHIGNTPYKGGNGDVVKEFAEACRKDGLYAGFYCWAPHPQEEQEDTNTVGYSRIDKVKTRQQSNKILQTRLEEITERLGSDLIREVWIDQPRKASIGKVLEELTPFAVFAAVGCHDPYPTIRWPGNEKGMVSDPCWSVTTWERMSKKASSQFEADANQTQVADNPDGDYWAPHEADVPLHDHFWHMRPEALKKRRSVEQLMECYINSVGRNSFLIVNCAPQADGSVHPDDMKRYEEFGCEIEQRFGHPITTVEKMTDEVFIVTLPQPQRIQYTDLWEEYRYGHRIREYRIEGWDTVLNKWCLLSEGTAVGRRKIDEIKKSPIIDKIRVKIIKNIGAPMIRKFMIH